MEYRREIDGLRAVSVLAVILYHAGFSILKGGYVGVDVFFVISGYLITSLIVVEINSGNFSFANFYERRARRILPALFFVMLVCLPFSWFLLMPEDMKKFTSSLAAVVLFVSNFLFKNQAGYFDSSVELKPLIHTWSLSVEEQFYFIFPILLILIWRFGRQVAIWCLLGLACISFLYSEWASVVSPANSFFLLPSRGWELLAGSCIALLGDRFEFKKIGRGVAEIMSGLGVFFLFYAFIRYDAHTRFPGVHAILPTLGASLIIFFARPFTLVGTLLGMRIFVGIGLISYSAYLWHQPLFAFVRHKNFEPLGDQTAVLFVFISLGIAYLSWQYIEKPFRQKSPITRREITLGALLFSTFFLLFGAAGHVSNGFKERLSSEQNAFLSYFENSAPNWQYFETIEIAKLNRNQCDFYDLEKLRIGQPTNMLSKQIRTECFERNQSAEKVILLWGDSHSQQLHSGLRDVLPASWQILQITSSGCEPVLIESPNYNDYCSYSNWFALQTIRKTKPDYVLIGQNTNHQVKKMLDVGDQVIKSGAQNVIFTGPTPHWTKDLPQIIVHRLFDHTPRKTWVGLNQEILRVDKAIAKEFPKKSNIHYVSISDYFCDASGCSVFFGEDVKSGISSWDYGHLTPIASRLLARDVLAKALKLP